jgi:hypothetical protein
MRQHVACPRQNITVPSLTVALARGHSKGGLPAILAARIVWCFFARRRRREGATRRSWSDWEAESCRVRADRTRTLRIARRLGYGVGGNDPWAESRMSRRRRPAATVAVAGRRSVGCRLVARRDDSRTPNGDLARGGRVQSPLIGLTVICGRIAGAQQVLGGRR